MKTMSAALQSRTEPGRKARRLGALARWESLLVVAILLDFALNAWTSPYFLDPWTLSDVTVSVAEKAIVALAMSFVIIAGEIDISVGGIIALSATATGIAAAAGWPIPALVVVSLATGLVCGCVNGLLVARVGVPSIVATIGTMTLFRGLAYAILGDGVLKTYPPGFSWFGQGAVAGPVSVELVILLVLGAVAILALHATAFGRRVIAIGSNPVAALMSGIAVRRLRFGLFALAGLASGLAALLLSSRLGSTRPSIAQGWELDIVTMVVLGGISIDGGVGTVAGVMLAAILTGLVTFGLGLLNVPGIVMSVVTGAMLIIVVAVPALLRRLGYGGRRA